MQGVQKFFPTSIQPLKNTPFESPHQDEKIAVCLDSYIFQKFSKNRHFDVQHDKLSPSRIFDLQVRLN